MSVEEMRVAIAKVYSGEAWKRKVRNMPDYQVMAIYFSFLETGKFDKPKKPAAERTEPAKGPSPFKPEVGVQITMFD